MRSLCYEFSTYYSIPETVLRNGKFINLYDHTDGGLNSSFSTFKPCDLGKLLTLSEPQFTAVYNGSNHTNVVVRIHNIICIKHLVKCLYKWRLIFLLFLLENYNGDMK